MRSKPNSCSGCPLHSHGTDFSMIEGTGSSGVMLVAEASGEMEARDQLPLRPYAPSGSVLERVLRRMGLDRRMFSITNCVRCRPRNNWLENSPHEYAALNHCRPNLDAAIAQFKPRCIVALGGIALRELTGEAGEARGIGHLAGYVLPLASRRVPCTNCISRDSLDVPAKQRMTDATCDACHGTGYVSAQGTIPVIGNFHPSYLRRGKASHQGIFARILQRAVNIAAGRDREWMWGVDTDERCTWNNLDYCTHPSLDDAWGLYYHLRDNPNLPLAKDLETSESTSLDEDAREGFQSTEIRLIQFSAAKASGMALPWEGGYREVAQRILHLPNPSYGHNWDNFDHKVLRACAAREGWSYAPTVRPHDTMNLFHHWQPDLPAHLQFCSQFISFPFPWKHLAGTDIEFYGCCDVDSDLQLGLYLEQKLKADGIWGDATVGYYGQVYEVRPILAAMEDRGVPIDDAARLRLGAEFDAEQKRVGGELMPLFPESAKKLDPYKTFPPELKKLPEAQWGDLFQEPDKWKCRCGRECKMDVAQCPKCHGAQADGKVKAGKWYRYGQREVQESAAVVVDGEPKVVATMAMRWCYIPEFNPNSGKQLIEYMKAKGHPVPKSKEEDDEGKQKDTTGKKELVRLARKVNDTFYLKVIEYRELSKLRGTYIEGFKPGDDSRVHTTFTFDTGIGQLSSRNPNVQNFIKHGRLAKATRAIIAAPPGYVLTEWDFKSCHVLTLGFLAEDANYIRCARIDMHSLMTGHYLKLWDIKKILADSDAELIARCKWLKSNPEYKHVRDAKVKHAGLGIGNGLKEKGLYERYMEYFASQREARDILRDYEQVFDKVFAWQKAIQQQAHRDQVLCTQFGHIRRFYEVFRWDAKKNGWGHGDQAEEAIAYWLANIAFGHIREKLKELHRAGLDEKYGLINNIHDSFLWCFPESMLEEHCREVYPVLVAPSKVLKHPTICPDGLVIEVDGAWGRNWSEMQEMDIKAIKRSVEAEAACGTA